MQEFTTYRDLEIYKLAKKLAFEVHKMTLSLPKFETYEEGSQIRRSAKSVVSNIVEGFARRNYKNDFLYYITISIGECDETLVHLEILYATESFKDKNLYHYLTGEYNKLGKMLINFYKSVLKNHISQK